MILLIFQKKKKKIYIYIYIYVYIDSKLNNLEKASGIKPTSSVNADTKNQNQIYQLTQAPLLRLKTLF